MCPKVGERTDTYTDVHGMAGPPNGRLASRAYDVYSVPLTANAQSNVKHASDTVSIHFQAEPIQRRV